jgi:hypothetical protein
MGGNTQAVVGCIVKGAEVSEADEEDGEVVKVDYIRDTISGIKMTLF